MSTSLEQQIRDYFVDCDVQQGAVDVALVHERTIDRTVTLAGIDDFSETEIETQSGVRGRWLGALAVAATVAFIVGGLVWLSGSDDKLQQIDEPPVPTTAPDDVEDGSAPVLPIDEPAVVTVVLTDLEGTAVDSETLSTRVVSTEVIPSSIGDLRWTQVALNPRLRNEGLIVATPLGFASVSEDGQLLISDDAVDWRVVESPFPGQLKRFFQEPGRDFFLETTDAGELVQWRSTDFVTWTNGVRTPSEPLFDLAGWIDGPEFLLTEVGTNFDRDLPVTPQGATLVNAEWNVDWKSLARQVGGDEFASRLENGEQMGVNSWDPDTGIVEITTFESTVSEPAISRSSGRGEPTGVRFRLSVSGTIDDWVVEFEDATQNESLGSITGSLPPLGPEDQAPESADFTLDDLAEFVATTGRFGAYFLSSEAGLELVKPPPWVSLPGDQPTFVLRNEELYVFYDSGAWRSPDGRTWLSLYSEESPTIQFRNGFFEGPSGVLVVAADLTEISSDDGPLPPLFLRSVDGIDWAPPTQPPSFTIDGVGFGHLLATDAGFLFLVHDRQQELVQWTSVDGDIWERVQQAAPFEPSAESAVPVLEYGANVSSIGNRSVFADSTVWIVEIVGDQ